MDRLGKIYGLFDPRTKCLHYVGKTVDSLNGRLSGHLNQKGLYRTNTRKNIWIRELLEFGLKPEISVLEIVPEYELEEAEIWNIAYFRAIGCDLYNASDLYNATAGGDGFRSLYWTQELREKKSKEMKERWKDPLFKKERSEKFKEAWCDASLREEKRKSANAQWPVPQQRQQKRETTLEQWKDNEFRVKRAKQQSKSWENPTIRQKTIQNMKLRWADPEYRKSQSERRKQEWAARKASKGIECRLSLLIF